MTAQEPLVPDDLLLLVALPPYFIDGLTRVPAKKSGEETGFFIRSETEQRWNKEFEPYLQSLDAYVFSGDVVGFRQFAEEHRAYYGQQYWKIQEMPDDLCMRLLQAIADERVRYEAEKMMPMQQQGRRHEA